MAFTSVGCIVAQAAFPTQVWPAGSKTIGPFALPIGFSWGLVLVDLTAISDLLATISWSIETSADGVNFSPLGGAALSLPISGFTLNAGGGLLDASGNPIRISTWTMRFPPSALASRQVRGTFTLDVSANVGVTIAAW